MKITVEEFCRKKKVLRKWKKNANNDADNTKENIERRLKSTRTDAFGSGFWWWNTPEGNDFWNTLFDKFEKMNK